MKDKVLILIQLILVQLILVQTIFILGNTNTSILVQDSSSL